MACDEHKQLADFLKEVHSSLRKSSSKLGAGKAWQTHCQNNELLSQYARTMETLATKHWEENCSDETSPASSRITWSADLSFDYFVNKSYLKFRQKEIDIGSKMSIELDKYESFSEPVKLIDVGSCYNPFKVYEFMDVLAIDLCPANGSVLQCDFLDVPIGSETIVEGRKLKQIKQNSFEIVTFCFVLEYIPSSELRIKACERAYSILKPGGLLIINTPDSKHVGANSKHMKCWRYTLAHIGFTRIRYEKLKYMHCMAFRKCLHKDIATRWALLHKEPYMEYSMHIPQDFHEQKPEALVSYPEINVSPEDFNELPFCDLE
ncbi:S-adenosylmethionine sensor upstream of mTORC1 [Epargyreus clarus]|uniref:S-adenosylmethionine sensor upstream of mTORC1 n=1 Tax=Epargyreus clarus TaxID=520877 RepID=UPI003C2B4625